MKRIEHPSAACAVPDFGPMVRRERLLKTIGATRHDLLVLAAPSGYGKSVLAAQVAEELYDDTVWIALRGQPATSPEVAEIVARRLGADVPESQARGVFAHDRNLTQLLEGVECAVRARPGRRVCVVLDDYAHVDGIAVVESLVDALRRCGPQAAGLIVTSRSEDWTPQSRHRYILHLEELRLDPTEASDLVAAGVPGKLTARQMSAVLTAGGGQPALVAVLARHAMTRPSVRLAGYGKSGVWDLLVDLATEQLSERELNALYVAALLGSGDVHELGCLGGADDLDNLAHVGDCIPLFVLRAAPDGAVSYEVHDLARQAFTSKAFLSRLPDPETLTRGVLAWLAQAGDHVRAAEVVPRCACPTLVREWLERGGMAALDGGGVGVVAAALNRLGSASLRRPRLLVLAARVALEHEHLEECAKKSMAAYALARAEEDPEAMAACLALAARAYLSLGRTESAAAVLKELFDRGEAHLEPNTRAMVRACAAGACALRGENEHALSHLEEAQRHCHAPEVTAETKARVHNYQMFVALAGLGMAHEGADLASRALRMNPLTAMTRMYLLGNRAGALFEMGRLRACESACSGLRDFVTKYGLGDGMAAHGMIEACALAARGEVAEALERAMASVEGCRELGDEHSYVTNLLFLCTVELASGHVEECLEHAEAGLEHSAMLGFVTQEHLAAVQVRAAFLALGDPVAAAHVEESRAWAVEHKAAHIALLADCILAEIDRLDGRPADGIARLRAHRDYILTESANWLLAMYSRAFPGLLGMLASAVGPEKAPTHLLKMVLSEHATSAMPIARETMPLEAWRTLARRIGYSTRKGDSASGAAARTGVGECHVRFFGGLEVTTADGPIPDRVWRKRKARAMFAMLVAARGKDVPREVLLETLWPGMDEERARNNLYVTWTAMKHALAPTAPKGGSCPYVETFAGVCRALPGLTSDIDQFDEAAVTARKAEQDGHVEAALASYDLIAEIYRGEFLSGDLYDDWCSQLRDRYRHEFGDAMLAAARLRAERREPERALQTVRVALVHDAWREDLYQAALTYQIECGQRSAAIETYMTCRTRLAEDLGLDPSLETRRLYDRILAMEGPPEDERDA